MKLEFKLVDGTRVIGDQEIFDKVKDNFSNNRLSTSSLMSVICVKTKEEFIFSMMNVVYIKVIP